MRSGLKFFITCLAIVGITAVHYNLFSATTQNVSASANYNATYNTSTNQHTSTNLDVPNGNLDNPHTPPLQSATATLAYTGTIVPTEVPTYTVTVVPTYTMTVDPSPTMTATVTATIMPTVVPTTTEMPTEVPTEMPTYTMTAVPSPTITATIIPTTTGMPELTPVPTGTPEPTEMPTEEPREGAMIYIMPEQKNLMIGESALLEVMVDPGNSAVNGVQIHAKVDPAYLEILSVQADQSELTNVLEPATFDAATGIFRYAAGLINETTGSEPFTVLQIEVKALAMTESTMVAFILEEIPPTSIGGPSGSVLDEARNAMITIQNESTLYGELALQGRPNGPSPAKSISVTVEVYPAGSMEMLETFDVMLDENAMFSHTGLMSGTYDLRFVSPHTLATKTLNVVIDGNQDEQFLGMLMEGDVVQDNMILLEDFNILSGAFHRCDSMEGFDERTDLNEDGCTSLTDFSLLAGNYNLSGDIIYDMQNPTPLPITEFATAQIELQMEDIAGKAVGESFEVTIFVDPSGSNVRGTTAHIVFDPTLVAVTEVELLGIEELPTTLQGGVVDNEAGSVSFSKGTLGDSIRTGFELAKLTMEVKQENDGSSLAFSNNFPATDVTGAQGSLLNNETLAGGQSSDDGEYQLYLPVIVR